MQVQTALCWTSALVAFAQLASAQPQLTLTPLVVTSQEWAGAGPCGAGGALGSGGASVPVTLHQVCSGQDFSLTMLSANTDGKLVMSFDGSTISGGAQLTGTIGVTIDVPRTVVVGPTYLPTTALVFVTSMDAAIPVGTAQFRLNLFFSQRQ